MKTIREMETKEMVRKIIDASRGDDLYRAKIAFRGLTKADLDKPYGESNKTPRQLIAEYEEYDKKINNCLKWIDSK